MENDISIDITKPKEDDIGELLEEESQDSTISTKKTILNPNLKLGNNEIDELSQDYIYIYIYAL